jgi:predicted nucleic acid-binding protein
LVDTNVSLDIVANDPLWLPWSRHMLEAAPLRGPLARNGIVLAELSIPHQSVEARDSFLRANRFRLGSLPRTGWVRAGKVFQRYRSGGDTRTAFLSDSLIGAHAAVGGLPLFTRDMRHYRTHFPTLALISPRD